MMTNHPHICHPKLEQESGQWYVFGQILKAVNDIENNHLVSGKEAKKQTDKLLESLSN